jgi:hypothetical protein
MPTGTRNTEVRFPLILVDRSKDPDDFGSGWLRLAGPGDLPHVRLTDRTDAWDAGGRPVAVTPSGVVLTATYPDEEVRRILIDWRSRAPIPLFSGGRTGETAVPFLIDDVIAARSRLTNDGRTPQPAAHIRILPIVLMLVTAVVLIPLVRTDTWGIGVAALLYAISAALMNRWSYPAGEWGDPPRRDPPDTISHVAFAGKVVFWSVAAAAATLAVLDWTEILPGFVSWA